jgi:hypothetical protein
MDDARDQAAVRSDGRQWVVRIARIGGGEANLFARPESVEPQRKAITSWRRDFRPDVTRAIAGLDREEKQSVHGVDAVVVRDKLYLE